MDDGLFSLRMAVASPSPGDHELFRQAAASSSVPVEIVEADSAGAISRCIADGADFVVVEGALSSAAVTQIVAAAKAAKDPPFTILLSEVQGDVPDFDTDALAKKPADLDAAKAFIERAIRVRLQSRVLVVDDSSTTRAIVRKMLAATRIPLDVTEAEEGFAALKLVKENEFDLAFLDYNMPGFSGLETLAEFRRENRRLDVVLMTAVEDESLSARAREQGAAFLKKPFFPADIEAALGRFYGFRALNPKRA
jgi:CheY-like chemotaxis protein